MSLFIDKAIHHYGNLTLCNFKLKDVVVFKIEAVPITSEELYSAQKPLYDHFKKVIKESTSMDNKALLIQSYDGETSLSELGSKKGIMQLGKCEMGVSSFGGARFPYKNVCFNVVMPWGDACCWVVERDVEDDRGIACSMVMIKPFRNIRIDFYIGDDGCVDWGETYIKKIEGNPVTHNLEEKLWHLSVLHILMKVCAIINCKNVSVVDVAPSKKYQHSRRRKNREPLIIYKTLVINGLSHSNKGAKRGLSQNRVHICRGHFKTYTDEKPLMGKHVGVYWWQPSVRGNKSKGVIMKDYKVVNDNQ